MYIALRWLIGLCLAMWVAVCCIELYSETSKMQFKGFSVNLYKSENNTKIIKRRHIDINRGKTINVNEEQYTILFHYAMFLAGALAVTVFNRKKEIALYTKSRFLYINCCATKLWSDLEFKGTASYFGVAVIKNTFRLWECCKKFIKSSLSKRLFLESHQVIHSELMKRIREYGEERRNLVQLLISALRENKNIRMQYQMETMAKNRLLRNIEDIQKRMNDSHAKYVSFQHLYLVTHQENLYLKARIKKIRREKEEAERNLICLVNEVYQSSCNELKAYCGRFIVKTRDNLLSSDVNVNEEIEKFLHRTPTTSLTNLNSFDGINLEANPKVAEILPEEELIVPMHSDSPKLKGLPGECIWTIKDKDGFIEKLYEYDCASDYDKGDTVRRIRKYSVYHDKDCLLDFANSRTALYEVSAATITLQQQEHYVKVEYPTSNKFLTGSQAFQKFLRDNQNFVQLPTSQRAALLCE